MHELSIASSILELAARHVPPGSVLTAVHVVAGPMRAIEEDAMQLAWEAVLAEAKMSAITLRLEFPPWTMHCPQCGCEWLSRDLEYICVCGCNRAYPVGGDELNITSIEVDEVRKESPDAYLSGRERFEAQR